MLSNCRIDHNGLTSSFLCLSSDGHGLPRRGALLVPSACSRTLLSPGVFPTRHRQRTSCYDPNCLDVSPRPTIVPPFHHFSALCSPFPALTSRSLETTTGTLTRSTETIVNGDSTVPPAAHATPSHSIASIKPNVGPFFSFRDLPSTQRSVIMSCLSLTLCQLVLGPA